MSSRSFRARSVSSRRSPHAEGGQSSGPLEIERPWDSHTDDHLALMDHLGVGQFMVLGFCIGGPFAWNLLRRAPGRIPAAVMAQPSGFGRNCRTCSSRTTWPVGHEAPRPAAPRSPEAMVEAFLSRMYRTNADFVFTVTRDSCVAAGRRAGTARRRARATLRGRDGKRDARAQQPGEPLSLEGPEGTHPARGAPHPQLSPCASPGVEHFQAERIREATGTMRASNQPAGCGKAGG